MANEAFTPRQVLLAPVPLVGTMGRAEVECAAAILVRVCQVRGTWGPVGFEEVGPVLKDDVESGHALRSTWLNPFLRPDFGDLVKRGFATWAGEPFKSALELTDAGREALTRWVRPSDD